VSASGKFFSFLPTRFTASLSAVMPGTELCKQVSRADSRSLPTTAFQRQRINATKSACSYFLSGAGFSSRPFARSERLSVHRTTIPRSTFLTYDFDALLFRLPARATFCSPARRGFDPATGGFNA